MRQQRLRYIAIANMNGRSGAGVIATKFFSFFTRTQLTPGSKVVVWFHKTLQKHGWVGHLKYVGGRAEFKADGTPSLRFADDGGNEFRLCIFLDVKIVGRA